MHICIDSCVFIQGLQDDHSAAGQVLNLIGFELTVQIPRLVAQEVTRNLRTLEQVRRFYRVFHDPDFALIIDEPIPRALVDKYIRLGLPEKADALIGAFAEWRQVSYLISSNRHFLRDLHTDAFTVLDAAEFVSRWELDAL